MAFTGTITITGSAGGVVDQQIISKTGGSIVTIDEAVDASQTDLLFNVNVDKDRVKMVYLVATENLTIETNSGSSPGDTLTLTADEPLIWWDGQTEATNPFNSADVTAFYLTNTTALTFRGFIVHDPTA